MGYADFPVAGILTIALACTTMSCWLSLLQVHSENVWPCALAHGASNTIANVGLVFCSCSKTLLGPSPLGFVKGIPLVALGACSLLRLPAGRAATGVQHRDRRHMQ